MKKNETEFKAVDFMRSAREKLTKQYHTDKTAFRNDLHQAMKEFRQLQKKVSAQ